MATTKQTEMTLALDGEVSPQKLAIATAAFADLLDVLSKENAPGISAEWIITDLWPGSSGMTAECRTPVAAESTWIPRIIEGGKRFAAEMENARVSPQYSEVKNRFLSLVGDRLVRVRLETPDKDFVLAGRPIPATVISHSESVCFGAVRGRVQAMTNRGSLRFTLYDINEDKAVSCYLPDGTDSEQMMIGLWGKVVEVEGRVRRDLDSGKPITVREITNVVGLEEQPWREAIGAARGFLGSDSAEDIIRRMRDNE